MPRPKEIILWVCIGLLGIWYVYKGDYLTFPMILGALCLARYLQKEKS